MSHVPGRHLQEVTTQGDKQKLTQRRDLEQVAWRDVRLQAEHSWLIPRQHQQLGPRRTLKGPERLSLCVTC